MTWTIRTDSDHKTGFFSYLFTIVSFCLATTISIITSSVMASYIVSGRVPTPDETKVVLLALWASADQTALSCLAGAILMLITLIITKSASYFRVFLTSFIRTIISIAFTYLASWLLWNKHWNEPSAFALTILPFTIAQLATFISLELASITLRRGTAHTFCSIAAIVGCVVGAVQSVNQHFYNSTMSMGVAFGYSLLDTSFFFSAATLTGVCIARSRVGGSFVWHLVALILPTILAIVYGLRVDLANGVSGMTSVIDSIGGRVAVAIACVLVAMGLSIGFFWPMRTRRGPVSDAAMEKENMMSAESIEEGVVAV